MAAPAGAAVDSRGTDFWLTFPGNLSTPALTLFIAGDTATTGTVTIPGLSFSQTFSVTPGTVTSVPLPSGADLETSDTVESLGIHVTSVNEVTVYGLNRVQFTTDAYLGLPTDALGKSYINLGYENTGIVNGTEFGIVATADGTSVTITPSATTGGHIAGTPYTVAMNQGQTYQLRNSESSTADLSGSIVSSDKPIALFGGHECANIPSGSVACDHVVEEIPPTTEWGQHFVSMPLATRTGGDTFRVLASTDNTTVSVNGTNVTLNRGQIAEQVIKGPSAINADKPILVMQYSNSSSFDGVTSDPFELMTVPSEQFLASYTVSTPASGFSGNYINIVAPAADVGAIIVDGTAVPSSSFTAIGASGFSGAQLPVALGSHSLSGPLPFGASVYGFDSFDSYGYPGGANFSPVATVASVTLAPKTQTAAVNTQGCVTATVTDSTSAPVVGIRVDFAVTGANPSVNFAFTDVAGHAEYCYTAANPGDDVITGTVGSLSDTAQKHWTSNGAAPPTAVITTPPVGAVYIVGQSVTAQYSCTAGTGGGVLKSCVGTVPTGSKVDTSHVATFTFTVTATDTDNQTGIATTTYSVKAGPPTAVITTPADGSVYRVGDSVNAAYACTAGPGGALKSCVGTVPSGSPLDTSTAGPGTFTVTATDTDGQAVTVTTHFVINKAVTQIAAPPLILKAVPGLRLAVFEVEATLTYGTSAKPLANELVAFTAGSTALCTGKTDAKGFASCVYSLGGALGAVFAPLSYQATFAGDSNYLGSSVTAPVVRVLALTVL